ncbi:hypothetical protein SAMN04487988_11911 [Algoriphagus hitonicola]|uniref:Uncharacterized protein n=1 Tax=Algoriphagus hitonicola TaxID=435880 RepID=A0A1I2XHW1_9BACT|nr:hypothetical protein [Algoriphagus hitonicola]SFH13002.1 hypothetical protein SAMN04487988_11911 [Algoriphagus hitonicola]
MKEKFNLKLDLSVGERTNLRKQKIKKSMTLSYAPDELAILLNVSEFRAKEIFALADFQQIPSIGIEFASHFEIHHDSFIIRYFSKVRHHQSPNFPSIQQFDSSPIHQ